jgi:hypothetical protein
MLKNKNTTNETKTYHRSTPTIFIKAVIHFLWFVRVLRATSPQVSIVEKTIDCLQAVIPASLLLLQLQ